MRCLDGKWIGGLGLTLVLGLTVVGCGDDDSSPGDAGPDGAVDGGGAGMGGKDSGTDASTTGTGGRMTTGGTGGMGLPMGATCDTTIPTTATCGGNACPAPASQLASFVCSVPCCLPDDSCGFRRAVMDNVTDCAAVATADPTCPDYQTMGPPGGMMAGGTGGSGAADAGDAGMGNTLPGCCAPSGHCGVISSIDMTCITSSTILMDLMPGAACGEATDGGSQDGG